MAIYLSASATQNKLNRDVVKPSQSVFRIRIIGSLVPGGIINMCPLIPQLKVRQYITPIEMS